MGKDAAGRDSCRSEFTIELITGAPPESAVRMRPGSAGTTALSLSVASWEEAVVVFLGEIVVRDQGVVTITSFSIHARW